MNFRELRVNAGLRQVDVAKKMQIDQTTISRWEVAKSDPLLKLRKKLAKLYGVDVQDIEVACAINAEIRGKSKEEKDA